MRFLLEREYAEVAIVKAKSIAAAIAHGPYTEGFVNLFSDLDDQIAYPTIKEMVVRIANRVDREIEPILQETGRWKEYTLSIEVEERRHKYIVRFRYAPKDVRKLTRHKPANLLD